MNINNRGNYIVGTVCIDKMQHSWMALSSKVLHYWRVTVNRTLIVHVARHSLSQFNLHPDEKDGHLTVTVLWTLYVS